MRVASVTWKPHVPIWAITWGLRELIAKGARVDYSRDPEWQVTW
jgi:hypothetical protein